MGVVAVDVVTIDEDAEIRIDQLGLRHEFRRMLDSVIQNVPDLQSVRVRSELPYDAHDDTRITIDGS